LDSGELQMGFEIPNVQLSANLSIKTEEQVGLNVLAKIPATNSKLPALVIGAHADHLGVGRTGSSLARDDEQGAIHFGADDNASGVAAVLEIAQYLQDLKTQGRLNLTRDIIFALWSAEELGLLGSEHFVNQLAGHEGLDKKVAAYLNMDMIGR